MQFYVVALQNINIEDSKQQSQYKEGGLRAFLEATFA